MLIKAIAGLMGLALIVVPGFVFLGSSVAPDTADSAQRESLRREMQRYERAVQQGATTMDDGIVAEIAFDPIVMPRIESASDASIPDETQVIGVVVEGRARAYVYESFDDSGYDIVNDRIGTTPVTVAFDMVSRELRVVTAATDVKTDKKTLELRVVGLGADCTIIQLGKKRYRFDAPDLPATDMPFTFTNWYGWQLLHPNSDLYVGDVNRFPEYEE